MQGEYVLETRGLSKVFGGFKAVADVDLKVRRHTIHALIGPNGAGKTTCFNLITKFLQPITGHIFLNGADITRVKPDAIARLGMVRSFQISAVFAHLTALENVRVALQQKQGLSWRFWASEQSLLPLHERAHALLDSVGIGAFAGVPAGELSYGRKRAMEIATTLALDPEVVLLDEPMAGLGREDVSRIAALIR